MPTRFLLSIVMTACLAKPAAAQIEFPAPDPQDGIPDSARLYVDETEQLRRRLIKLTMDKASMMTAEELQRAIVEAEHDNTKLPPAALEILETFEKRAQAIKKEANSKINTFKEETIDDLKLVQDKFTRQGQLDEAVAIRNLIRALKRPPYTVRADPGSLTAFQNQVGKTFYFKVKGTVGGPLWGTKIYTSDSSLATAAVHAGLLKKGETGIVKVTMLPGQNSYKGTANQNGTSSSSYGQYPSSYRVEAVQID